MAFALMVSASISAQGNGKGGFDPKRFEMEMEQFIVKEACLTPQEAAVFFPVFREMQRKQRVFFGEMMRHRHTDLNDNVQCAEAIEKMDQADIEMKKIQQCYHKKFIKILPAGKVLKIIKAEAKFHRAAFKNAMKRP